MTLASFVGLVAAGMGALTVLSSLLQARRMRDAPEVGSSTFVAMRALAGAWLLYGVATADLVVIIPNAIALVATTQTLLAIRPRRSAAEPAIFGEGPPRRDPDQIRGEMLLLAQVGGLVRR